MTHAIKLKASKDAQTPLKVFYIGPDSYITLFRKVRLLDIRTLPSGINAMPILIDDLCANTINKLNAKGAYVTPETLVDYFFENGLCDFDKKIPVGCAPPTRVYGTVWRSKSKPLTELLYAFIKYNYNSNADRPTNSYHILSDIIGKAADRKDKIYDEIYNRVDEIEAFNKDIINPK